MERFASDAIYGESANDLQNPKEMHEERWIINTGFSSSRHTWDLLLHKTALHQTCQPDPNGGAFNVSLR